MKSSIRTVWSRPLLLAALATAASTALAEPAAPPEPIAAMIRQAGNAEDDAVRLEILKNLAAKPEIEPALKADLARLLRVAERWVDTRDLWQWFGGPVHRTADYDFGIAEDSPLDPLACFYRARMLVAVTNESGHIISYHDKRRQFLDKAVAQFKTAARAFPENRIIRMYLGEPIPVEKHYAAPPEAPAWAGLSARRT